MSAVRTISANGNQRSGRKERINTANQRDNKQDNESESHGLPYKKIAPVVRNRWTVCCGVTDYLTCGSSSESFQASFHPIQKIAMQMANPINAKSK
jgi:hypothetical protein